MSAPRRVRAKVVRFDHNQLQQYSSSILPEKLVLKHPNVGQKPPTPLPRPRPRTGVENKKNTRTTKKSTAGYE